MPRAATRTVPAVHLTPGVHIEHPSGEWVPVTAVTHGATVAETTCGDAIFDPGEMVPTRTRPGAR